MSFYDQSVTNAEGEEISMKEFEGKVVLVVNTATKCGFTPHYKDIEAMYERYHGRGLEVIDVPCNQFAGLTPGTDEEIHEFVESNYNTRFPQMKKSDVNGEDAIPLFQYLKSQKGFEGFGRGPRSQAMDAILSTLDKNYRNNPEIKWNFTKFVVDRNGDVVARFEPIVEMRDVERCVERLL